MNKGHFFGRGDTDFAQFEGRDTAGEPTSAGSG